MGEPIDRTVEELRAALERELGRSVQPYRGCWPLGVALGGVLLGLALLAGWL